MKIAVLAFAFLLQQAWSVPEKDFDQLIHSDVMPYFANGHQRTFINAQGMKLNYYSFVKAENTKTIVILPGRTEPALKYAELVFDLRDQKANIYVLDHQGQGASDRLLKDTHKGHVEHFVNYARDLSNWLDEVVIPETKNQERFLIGHSMGGAVATIYLAYGKQTFKKAVLSCPMMEVNTKPYKENIGRLLTNVLVLAGQGKKYAPERGPYVADEDTFEKNEVTHSEKRFAWAKAIFVAWPEVVLGGPTARWVNQSLKTTKKIDSIAGKIQIPLLMFQSGLDLIVNPGRQNSFCQKSGNCQMVKFANGHHEILQETDDIRDLAVNHIKTFINN
ncbi:MAG: alpha/beta fold hydrolase [Bdellovibrionales bacterium]|nr:alpha/beta fold hydrolase [Bdellovibrionales bacterium]